MHYIARPCQEFKSTIITALLEQLSSIWNFNHVPHWRAYIDIIHHFEETNNGTTMLKQGGVPEFPCVYAMQSFNINARRDIKP
jgi:hypothetical protein